MVGGALLGVVSSALPFELGVPFALIVGVTAPFIWSAWKRVSFDGRFAFSVGSAAWLATVGLCVKLPFKYVDRTRVTLSAECVSLDELANVVHARNTVTDAPLVCFSERTPTVRTIQKAIEQQTSATLHIGFCGTGASFLFGASPKHFALERR